jgi:DNA polymerase-3 subunit beta
VRRKGKFAATFKTISSPKLYALLPRGQDQVTVHSDPGRIGMVTEDTLIIGRQIEGPYPDYNRVIPKADKPSNAVVPIDVLSSAVRRAMVFAHPVGRLIAVHFQPERVRIEAETPELGRCQEELDCEYSGKDIRIGFNASYLLEILRHIESEKVRIELQGPLAAAVVVPEPGDEELAQTYLLMPIRLE